MYADNAALPNAQPRHRQIDAEGDLRQDRGNIEPIAFVLPAEILFCKINQQNKIHHRLHNGPAEPCIVKAQVRDDRDQKKQRVCHPQAGHGDDACLFPSLQKIHDAHGQKEHIKDHRASQYRGIGNDGVAPDGNAVRAIRQVGAGKQDDHAEDPKEPAVFNVDQGGKQRDTKKHQCDDHKEKSRVPLKFTAFQCAFFKIKAGPKGHLVQQFVDGRLISEAVGIMDLNFDGFLASADKRIGIPTLTASGISK